RGRNPLYKSGRFGARRAVARLSALARIVHDAAAGPGGGAAGLPARAGILWLSKPSLRGSGGTLRVQRDGRGFTVDVVADGDGLVSHAGAALLAEAADRLGFTPPLSGARAPWGG